MRRRVARAAAVVVVVVRVATVVIVVYAVAAETGGHRCQTAGRLVRCLRFDLRRTVVRGAGAVAVGHLLLREALLFAELGASVLEPYLLGEEEGHTISNVNIRFAQLYAIKLNQFSKYNSHEITYSSAGDFSRT